MLLNFDFDGVFVDSFGQILGAAASAQAALGLGRSPKAADLRQIANLTFEDLGRALDVPSSALPAFTRDVFEHLQDDPVLPPLVPGMAEVAIQLARSHTLAVITSTATRVVEQVLEEHGLRNCVAGILDGQAPGAKSEKIAGNLARFKSGPAASLMIGDTLGDVTEGRRAGVRTIAVTWGFQTERFLSQGRPDFVARRPSDLVAIVESITDPA